jgi:hypothetical protein
MHEGKEDWSGESCLKTEETKEIIFPQQTKPAHALRSHYQMTGYLEILSRIIGKYLQWWSTFGAEFSVSEEGEMSAPREMGAGVPQGSVLFPTLYNMYKVLQIRPGLTAAQCS